MLILGAAYRGGVKEVAFTGVFPLRDDVESLGTSVLIRDPLNRLGELVGLGFFALCAAARQSGCLAHRSPRVRPMVSTELIVDGRAILIQELWPWLGQ